MRSIVFTLLAVGLISLFITGCSDKDSDPIPIDQSNNVWIFGWQDSTGYAMILKSADAGLNWIRQGEGQSALLGITLNDIWAVDQDIIWAVGEKNSILKTMNGGVGWTKYDMTVTPSTTEFLSISMADRNSSWISGGEGIIVHSPDAGATWIKFNDTDLDSAQFQGICAVNTQRVFAVGGIDDGTRTVRGRVVFTVDGGNDWERMTAPLDFNKWEWIGVSSSGNNMVIYGGRSHYMFSNNQGETWTPDSIPGIVGGDKKGDINRLIMLSPDTWWAACDEGHIAYTTDAGQNWTLQQTGQGGYFLVGIDAWDPQLAIATGISESLPTNIPILRTTDGGTTWKVVKQVNCNLNKVSFVHH